MYLMLFSSHLYLSMEFQAEIQVRALYLELCFVKSTRTTVKDSNSLEKERQWQEYFKEM